MAETCRGCEQPIPEGEDGTLWVTADLGDTTLKVHKDQDCAREALRKTGYKLRPGNKPRANKREDDKAKFRRQAGGR